MLTKPQFILYSRYNCHLCEDMLEIIQSLQHSATGDVLFELLIIDVDKNPLDKEKYGLKIPILFFVNDKQLQEVCQYYFDQKTFLEYVYSNKH